MHPHRHHTGEALKRKATLLSCSVEKVRTPVNKTSCLLWSLKGFDLGTNYNFFQWKKVCIFSMLFEEEEKKKSTKTGISQHRRCTLPLRPPKRQLQVRNIPSHLGSGWFQLRLTPWRQVRAEFPISVYPGKHSNEIVWPTVKSLPMTKPFRNGRGSGQLCNW